MTVRGEGSAIAAGVRPALLSAPPGWTLDASGVLQCPLDETMTGSFGVRIGWFDKDGRLIAADDRAFTVPRKDGRNLKPLLRLPAQIEASEGAAFYHRVDAWDPDGDALTFSAAGLPEGAHIDAQTGEIFWDAGLAQGGEYGAVKITVSDGQQQGTAATKLVVRDRPVGEREHWWLPLKQAEAAPELDRLRGFDLILALRHAETEMRLGALGRMEPYGGMFRLLEGARLLRDRDPRVAAAALAACESLLGAASGGANADGRLLGVFLLDVEPHLWHFTDAPGALGFVTARAEAAKGMKDAALRAQAEKILKQLKEVDAYNKKRGI